MNKKFFVFLISGMMVGAQLSSCSKDDGEDSGAPGEIAGALVGDDIEANALLEGKRLSSVDSYSYSYDSNGILNNISYRYWEGNVNGSTITWKNDQNGDDETYTINVINNHIVSLTMKSTYRKNNYYSENTTGSASFTYNSKGQLASISTISSTIAKDDGKTYKEGSTGKVSFNYSSDHRLLSYKTSYKWDDGSYEKETFTCNYSNDPRVNTFYQYTPNMIHESFSDMEAFFYIGLLGKASSYIPSNYIYEWIDGEDGDEEKHSGNRTSKVTYNSNGTISKADGKNYYYTSVGTRAVANQESSLEFKDDNCGYKGLFPRSKTWKKRR